MQVRYDAKFGCYADVDSATVIAINDLLYLDTDDVKPASDQADQGTPQENRQLFKDNFIGVAAQRSQATETDQIRILKEGVADADCASTSWEVGDLVGVAEQPSGTALENQAVVKVTNVADAIGICVKKAASSTTCRFWFQSSLLGGNAISG